MLREMFPYKSVNLQIFNFIIWMNLSALKMSFLIGSLSGPNFPMWTAKIDCSRKDLTKLCLEKI